MRAINKVSLFRLLFALILFFCCIACKRQEPAPNKGPIYGAATAPKDVTEYKIGVFPNKTQINLTEDYLPLIELLNSKYKNVRFSLDTSRDFPSYEAKIKEGKLDFLFSNPWQTLEAEKTGYKVIAMVGDAKDFKGLIVVRKDSGIRAPRDLKGKTISYSAPTALASCIMIQYHLHKQGINALSEIDSRYVVSLESALMNAYLKETVAAGTSPRAWRTFQDDHPIEAQKLTVISETPHLINNSVMARKDVKSDVQEVVRNSLLKLHETPKGQKILKGIETDRFFEATDNDYEIVRDFVERFEKEVRPVKPK